MTGVTGVCALSDGLLARRDEAKITSTDRVGKAVEQYTDICACKANWSNSYNLCEIESENATKYLIDVCYGCGAITAVDRQAGLEFKAFRVKEGVYDAVCAGPKGTILLTSSNAHIDKLVQLNFDEANKVFHQIMDVKCPASDVLYMKYNDSPRQVRATFVTRGEFQDL